MMLMGAALLPLAVLSYVQTLAAERVAESRARAAILGDTLIAASPQVDLLMQAQGAVSTLAATLPRVIYDNDACAALVKSTAQQSGGVYSFVGFIPTDGKITCTSADAPHDLADSPWLKEMLEKPETRLTVNRNGPISGTSILNLSTPVYGPYERLLGFASVSLRHSAIEARQSSGDVPVTAQPLTLLTFDSEGEILTSTSGMDGANAMLPMNHSISDFIGQPGMSFLDRSVGGQDRAFAVVPLSPGKLYALGSWPSSRLGDGFVGGLPPLTFPFLMWAASLLVAWLAAEGQVLRHVRALRNSITAFAGGDRKVEPLKFDSAAAELRDAARAYETMMTAILHDEAELENIIHQKEVLLREVHHRVKNNLQLIASILNMQLRTARTPEARMAMKSVQERVLSLATIHRELYQTTGQADIRANELFPRIVQHLLRLGASSDRAFKLDIQVDDLRLTPDQAVPLALFLTEGLTSVIRQSWGAGRDQTPISVYLTRLPDGLVRLELGHAVSAAPLVQSGMPALDAESEAFGGKLLLAFAQQLDGGIEKHARDDWAFLSMTFLLASDSAEAPPAERML